MNNYIETLDLPNRYSENKILSISFILFDKLHEIKYRNDEYFWCSIKTVVSYHETEIFIKQGIIKDEKSLIELRNLILTKI